MFRTTRYLAIPAALASAWMVSPCVDRQAAVLPDHLPCPTPATAPLHRFTPAPFVADATPQAALGTDHFEQDWQTRVTEDIRRSEYHIRHQEHVGALQSPNRAQDLRITYHTDGFSLTPRVDPHAWWSSMRLRSIGRDSTLLLPIAAPAVKAEEALATFDHGPFTIRYTNDETGMRQDFIVEQRPAGSGNLTVQLHYEGSLLPVLKGEDDLLFTALDSTTGTHTSVIWYRGLMVLDATGRELNAHMRLEEDIVELLVHDEGAAYPITIDPLSTTANWIANGGQADAQFGVDVGTAGDVNGDGYSDVIIGAVTYDGGTINVGAAFVYHGSATGLGTTPAWTRLGTQAGAGFGISVSTAGDINGDGYSDVVVGAPDHTHTISNEGAAFVFFGGSGGVSGSPRTFASGVSNSEFGFSVATAGDVNGDGISDMIVGAWALGGERGRVFVYHGNAGPAVLNTTADWTMNGAEVSNHFGFNVSSAGDVNRDGYSDVIIGEPHYSEAGQTWEGRALVFLGSDAGVVGATLAAAAWTGEGEQALSDMGNVVAWAGDVNGDGFGDVLVGLNAWGDGSTGLLNEGAVRIYFGNATGVDNAVGWEVFGGVAQATLGIYVDGAGDVNGDGYADVIIGAQRYDLFRRGAAYVYFGSASGPSATPDWSQTGSATFDIYGYCVGTAGDVNGDGYSDVIVGAFWAENTLTDEGRTYVYHGSPQGLSTTAGNRDGSQDHARFGWSVSTAGDVNRDGYSDVIIGAPLYDAGQTDEGRAFLYLGAAGGLATTAAWTAESDQNNAQFGYCVSTAGDVNGDGYSDVIIGAPYYNGGEAGEGRAYLFQGINAAAGLSAAAAATRESDQVNAHFGWSVNTAGDVNGDGYSDVIIGAPDYDNGETDEGRAYVYLGGTGSLGTAWTTESDQAGAQLGAAVAGGGDVNGDGYGDVIIGVPLHDGTFANEGQARIHAGWVNGLLDTPLWTATGGKANSSFGGAVAMAGDVDANGRTDVIVGAPFYDVATTTSNEGRASLFLSGPAGVSTSAGWAVNGGVANANLGFSVSKAGDVNGDGYGDIVVGAPGWVNGRMQAYHGSPTGPATTAALEVSGTQAGQRYAASVSNSGSQSGDGYGDVVVGSPQFDITILFATYTDRGRAYLYNGNNGRTLSARTRQYRPNLTTPVQPGNGTFSGDCGWGIGQIARSSIGRRRMKLVWEVTGHGPPFSQAGGYVTNSVEQSGQSAAWSNSATPTEIKQALTNTASAYPRWRARLRHHPATMIDGQPFGRWYYFGIHDRQEPAVKTTTPDCGLLPVELLSFNGACIGRNIDLDWSTASEHDNAYFTLWHSSDHDVWTEVERISGSVHSQQVTHYHYEHVVTAPSGPHYYRLAQTDVDGTTKLVANIHVPACGSPTSTFLLHPNPATDRLYVTLGADTPDGDRELQCIDAQGRIVLKRMLSPELRHAVNVSTLPPGLYLFKLHIDGTPTGGAERLVKQ